MMGRTSASKKFSIEEPGGSSGVHYLAQIGGSNHVSGYAVGIAFDPEGYAARTKMALVAEGTSQGYSRGKFHFLLDAANDSGEATLSESRMTINDSGKVLIGNGSVYNPSGMLHIVGDDNSNGPELYLQVANNNTTDNIGALLFGNNVDKSICMIRGGTHTANNTGDIQFHTSNAGTMSEKFRINNGGQFTAQSTAPALYGYYTSVNDTNNYVDFSQWTRDSFTILEIFGNVNPNSGGSGAYSDPVHMYVYKGVGWTGSRVGYYIYCVSVAPPARHAFPSGTGYSGNAQISAVWTDGSSVIGNETATSTHYMRLQIPNGANSFSFPKQFRIFRRR